MDDAEASPGSRASAAVVSIAAPRSRQGRQDKEGVAAAGQGGVPPPAQTPQQGAPVTSFDRRELSSILKVYGRKVAEGEWRDYAIDFQRDEAVFSIFRRASEMPLFRIVKDMRLARRQGAYSVVAAGGMILKRGSDLDRVLAVLEKRRALRLVEA